MGKEKLFQEFDPVSTEDWKEKIIKDLKGADYNRKLVWKTKNGFELEPFYRREDLKELEHLNTLPGNFPFVRGNNATAKGWVVNQIIEVNNIEDANKEAVEIKMKGADSLSFIFKDDFIPTETDIENLLKNIRIDILEVNFKTQKVDVLVKIIESLARKHNRNLEDIKGSIFCDPLSEISLSGNPQKKESLFLQLTSAFEAGKNLPNFHCLTIDGSIFHNAGSSTSTEMASALSMGVEYLSHLTGRGVDIDEISKRIRFSFATGSSYFTEIAKIRALRFLWAKIVNEFGICDSNSAKMYIHSVSSNLNKTLYDPYVNMLRTTTETMSAALGGADSITVLPFDITKSENPELGKRIARNQQLLLKGESHFDKVNDAAAGSYYIENLTGKLIESSWKLFLEIEEKGGYLKAFESGFITEIIETEASQLKQEVAVRKRQILGTNQYPNTLESIEDFRAPSAQKTKLAIRAFRASDDFEKLRLRTDKFSASSKRPKVWMLTYGNLAMRKARAQFAANFFGCAGFETIDNLGFETIDEGIEAAKASKADIVVICSSDEEYKEIALPIFETLKDETIVVLAGYPKEIVEDLKSKGFKNFIHDKSNVIEELVEYQSRIGIKTD